MKERGKIIFRDLGKMEYQQAWDYQEELVRENIVVKSRGSGHSPGNSQQSIVEGRQPILEELSTTNYLLFVEHPSVYTLGKSGKMENVLIGEEERASREISFYHTNRGGDITFHGPGQLVGYPILDLEKFGTDIGKYLRKLEEVIILTLAEFGIKGERSAGETGVWIEPGVPGRERKICAMGVRCSRWITMHGFALNVNTDLSYFDHIIPCGITNKQVTSLQKELNGETDINSVKDKLRQKFEQVFEAELV